MSIASIRNVASTCTNQVRKTFNEKIKPHLNKESIKQGIEDSFEYVRKNPKKVVKYSAIAVGVTALITGIAKAIKHHKTTEKKNEILTKMVTMQRETINDLKDFINVQKEIIETNQEINKAQKK